MTLLKKYWGIFLLVYLLVITYLMLFGFGRTANDFKQIQLFPFKTISSFFENDATFYDFFINIVCNIILFIPFGMVFWLDFKFRSLKFIIIVFYAWLAAMEFTQYETGRGMADIDDLILNTMGFLTGLFLSKKSGINFK